MLPRYLRELVTCGKWPTFSPLLTTLIANLSKQLSNSLSQASMSPMDGSKYPCKPAWKPRTAEEIAKICFAN